MRVSDSCNSCDCHNQRGRILQVLLHYWVRPEMNRTIPHIRQIQCRSHCYSGNQHQIQVLYDNVKTSEKNHLSKWLLHEKVPKKTAPVLVFPSKSLTAKKPAKHCKNHTTWKLKKTVWCVLSPHRFSKAADPVTSLLACDDRLAGAKYRPVSREDPDRQTGPRVMTVSWGRLRPAHIRSIVLPWAAASQATAGEQGPGTGALPQRGVQQCRPHGVLPGRWEPRWSGQAAQTVGPNDNHQCSRFPLCPQYPTAVASLLPKDSWPPLPRDHLTPVWLENVLVTGWSEVGVYSKGLGHPGEGTATGQSTPRIETVSRAGA